MKISRLRELMNSFTQLINEFYIYFEIFQNFRKFKIFKSKFFSLSLI